MYVSAMKIVRDKILLEIEKAKRELRMANTEYQAAKTETDRHVKKFIRMVKKNDEELAKLRVTQ